MTNEERQGHQLRSLISLIPIVNLGDFMGRSVDSAMRGANITEEIKHPYKTLFKETSRAALLTAYNCAVFYIIQ